MCEQGNTCHGDGQVDTQNGYQQSCLVSEWDMRKDFCDERLKVIQAKKMKRSDPGEGVVRNQAQGKNTAQ